MTLVCIKCREEKDIDFFVKDSGKKIGYRPTCKNCRNVYLRGWNIENKEKRSETQKRYVKNNPKKLKESSKKYYDKIKGDEKIKIVRAEISRRWSKTEKGKLLRRIAENKRRSLAKETDDGTVNYENIQELMRRQNFQSAISKEDISQEFHIDHIIPLCEGGKNTISNIQLLTPKENLRKGTKNGF